MKLKFNRAMLVYQAGLANVFAVDSFNMVDYGRGARRLMQGTHVGCEYFAQGLAAAGVMVRTAHCNMAGDIAYQKWSDNLDEAPFREGMRPVEANCTGVPEPLYHKMQCVSGASGFDYVNEPHDSACSCEGLGFFLVEVE